MKKILKLLFFVCKQNKPVALTAIWLTIIGDILFGQKNSDVVIFGIIGLYAIFTGFYKLRSKTTFSFCFFILGFLFIEFIFTGASVGTEKAAVWLFLSMAIGIAQELVPNKR